MDARTRLEIIERDEWSCQLCGGPGQEIDHIIPRSKFGKRRKAEQEHPDNLQVLCLICHRKKHG